MTKHLSKECLFALVLGYSIICLVVDLVDSCGPGRVGGGRRMLRKYRPLVQRQYIPNLSENTLGASGPPEGAIRRTDKRFKELVQYWNADIEFRDDERTGADRMMSQRLKEKLSTLAISVMNQWPGVKLRVIEGWDEDYKHAPKSLHYEGRAIDITTSDLDRAKYGMLARLAVEAGFDWVHYESRSHVHCSVKSEKGDTIRNNGCFDGESLVETPEGQVKVSQLQLGDSVLTMSPQSGQLQFSPVIMWLDRHETSDELFVELHTKSGKIIRLTPSHLIYVADESTEQQSFPANYEPNESINPRAGDTPNAEKEGEANTVDGTIEYANNEINHGDYYSYKLTSADGVDAISPEVTTAASTTTSTTTMAPKYLPFDPSMLLAQNATATRQLTAVSIEELTSPIYAKNAVVGQYLLVNEPEVISEEAEEEEGDDYSEADDSTVDDSMEMPADPIPPKVVTVGPNEHGVEEPDAGSGTIRIDQTSQVNDPSGGRRSSRLEFTNSNEYSALANPLDQTTNSNIIQSRGPTISTSGSRAKYDQLVSINYVTRRGIYAPLTREGNIVVNSVVASCYALVRDHDLAHLTFAPVRWYSHLNEWFNNMRPNKPVIQREPLQWEASNNFEVTTNSKQYEFLNAVERHLVARSQSYRPPEAKLDENSPYQRETNSETQRRIHWYPLMLYKIARFILPEGYLL